MPENVSLLQWYPIGAYKEPSTETLTQKRIVVYKPMLSDSYSLDTFGLKPHRPSGNHRHSTLFVYQVGEPDVMGFHITGWDYEQ